MRKVLKLCLSATATSRKQNKWIGRKVLSRVSRTGRDPGLHVAITCLGSRQEIYLLQDHHVNQRDAFWQVPQVSNIVVQKIILTKEKEKRTNKLNRDFGHRASQTVDFPPSLLEGHQCSRAAVSFLNCLELLRKVCLL